MQFNKSGGSRKLQRNCADRVRKYLATVRKVVYSDATPKGFDKSQGLQRKQLPKCSASRAEFSTTDISDFKRTATATHISSSVFREKNADFHLL